MPSHTDIEGNEQTDESAKEGVKTHEVKLQKEMKESVLETKKTNRDEEDGAKRPKRSSKGRYEIALEEVLSKAKGARRSGMHVLLDLGPLLPNIVVGMPS